MSTRKHQTQTRPSVASESQLLSELREMKRQTHETMADLKALLKALKEERAKVESLIQEVNEGQLAAFVSEVLRKEVDSHIGFLQETTVNARDKIEEQIARMASSMTSAILGAPIEIIQGEFEFGPGLEIHVSAEPEQ